MPPVAAGLVLLSIVPHVAWNAVLRTTADPLRASSRGLAVALAVTTPLAATAWFATGRPGLGGTALALGGVSALLETVYFVTLSAAYRRGELSIVYPIARGTAPMLAVGVAVVVLGERLSLVSWVGVAGLLGGLLLIRPPRAAGAALPWALACGCAIAGYSAVDSIAVDQTSAWLYGWVVLAITTPLLAAAARLGSTQGPGAAPWGRSGVMGVSMSASYLLVLSALALAPLAAVAPLREASVVVAGAWGVIVLREVDRARHKITGAALVAAGAVLLLVG